MCGFSARALLQIYIHILTYIRDKCKEIPLQELCGAEGAALEEGSEQHKVTAAFNHRERQGTNFTGEKRSSYQPL